MILAIVINGAVGMMCKNAVNAMIIVGGLVIVVLVVIPEKKLLEKFAENANHGGLVGWLTHPKDRLFTVQIKDGKKSLNIDAVLKKVFRHGILNYKIGFFNNG